MVQLYLLVHTQLCNAVQYDVIECYVCYLVLCGVIYMVKYVSLEHGCL